MVHRKDAVSLAVIGLLATCGFASAATSVTTPQLSLEPTGTTPQVAGAPSTPLMMGLDKLGVGKPVSDLGINIYGWVEGGYRANLRQQSGNTPIAPNAFTQELGNHFDLNQLTLRIEKIVDSKKFDVGGLVEATFGTDSNFTEANGIEYQTYGDNPGEVPHFDIPQAYVDVNIPIGNGLKIRAGHFYSLLGYESIDPRGNPFYSHSDLFEVEPLTNTGVVGFYNLNDQWSVAAGITRGFNQATEDVNGAPDVIGQVTYTPNKQWQFMLNYEVGPQDPRDTSHYDVMVNPIAIWQTTDRLKLAVEGIYEYDGNFNGFDGVTHAYGDDYGASVYGQYVINDYLVGNLRAEWLHTYFGSGLSNADFGESVPSLNMYEITAGVSIKPMPHDPIGQNLVIRPEIRYDFSEDHAFQVGSGATYRDQWTVGADVIFTF